MPYPDTISIAALEAVLNSGLDALKAQYGEDGHIPLERDYYWHIDNEALYDMDKDPIELTIGSLCEDSQIIEESGERGVLPFDVYKAAMLLRYLGENHYF
ncbi:hypothetical protein [Hymenobacter sp. BT190]|uniref:hypothetical protein n=1 Tax=Hymenobacter sp. BT190 TaxID=2763505 RepID=UPI001651075B|nr:hypothetical protein [Hymenobacter sp. BT190]MBC6699768.1 hypothetical protein [Hymenobacter sp. BT190]